MVCHQDRRLTTPHDVHFKVPQAAPGAFIAGQ